MEIDWRSYLRQYGKELRIIFFYSLIITVLTQALQFVGLDYELVVTLLQLSVFFYMAYCEDSETVELPWPDLVTRFTIAWAVLWVAGLAQAALKSNFLEGNLSEYDTDDHRASLVILSICVEYLDDLRLLSAARMFLIVAFLICFAIPDIIMTTRISFEFLSSVFTSWLPN